MARDTATKWIIGLLIYFVVLFFFLSMVNSLQSDYSLYDDETITSSGGSYGLQSLGTCEEPRDISIHDIKCKSLTDIGKIYDASSCGNYTGCSWEESGKFLGIFGATTWGCEGNINLTYYHNGVNFTSVFGATDFGYFSGNVCTDLTNVSNNAKTCSAFGCTWYPDNTFQELKIKDATNTIFGVIGDVVTLRVSFATTNSGVNAVLTFFLIWIPLILLMLSGYIMIR